MNNLSQIIKTAKDIETITIQGATNIAKAAISVLGQEIKNNKFGSISDFDRFLKEAMKILKEARETEPMLFNGLKYCSRQYQDLLNKKSNLNTIQKKLSEVCKEYVVNIEKEEKIRPKIGAKLIKLGNNIMTHCHSGSVVKILTTARNQNKEIRVYNTETRPLYQGRKTSSDLINAGVPNTMITDDSAPFFVDNLYESHVFIDMVIIGCDSIKSNGSVYNKIGSFSIAMAARHAGTPVYVVGSLLKIDNNNKVKIERRSGKELRSDAPKGLEIINYAFDLVPAKFITGIITEFGIIKPKDIKNTLKKYYPRMLQNLTKK